MTNDQQHDDLFAPENVDERIEHFLQGQHLQENRDHQEHAEVQLVRKLQSIYQEDADILKHARARLFQHTPETKTSPVSRPHDRYKGSYTMNSQANIVSANNNKKRPLIQRINLLVAGLVAALLVGSLVAVLTLVHHTQTDTAGTPRSVLPQPPSRPQPAQSKTAQIVSTRSNGPWGIALDETRGFVYVAAPGCDPTPPCATAFPTKIGQHSLADGHFIRQFVQPEGYSNPFFVAVNPTDGHVWFTEPNSAAIGELNPNKGTWAQYKVMKGSVPYDLVMDKNGNIWFTEFHSNSIGFLNTKTHKIVETPTPTANSNPYGITKDNKGNIWFTENGHGISRIGMFTPGTSGKISIKEFSIDASRHVQPHLITAAPNGHIWFSEGFLGSIGELAPANGSVTHHKVAIACRRATNCTHISGIAADPQGNIWFTDSLNATVGYYIPKGIEITQGLHDPNSHPHDGLVVQSNGTVWFTEQFGSMMKGDPVQGPALVMWPAGTLNGAKGPSSVPTPTAVPPTPVPALPTTTPTIAPPVPVLPTQAGK